MGCLCFLYPAQQHAFFGLLYLDVLLGILAGTEGGNLYDLATEMHMRQTEAPANQPTVPEDLTHLLRAGIGGNIEIPGLTSEQDIPYAAPTRCAW